MNYKKSELHAFTKPFLLNQLPHSNIPWLKVYLLILGSIAATGVKSTRV